MVHPWDRYAMEGTSTRPNTLVDVLNSQSQLHPNRLAYTYLLDGEACEQNWTYSDLHRQAVRIAVRIREEGLTEGDRALLLYQPGLDFIAGFFGCLYAGVIAVPVYPPLSARDFPRLLAVLGDATPKAILTSTDLLAIIQKEAGAALGAIPLPWIPTDGLDAFAGDLPTPSVTADSIAFLQYTSGSTGKPKGVIVSHGNILANQAMIAAAFGHSEESIVVGWLPVYHDMGLIGNVLQPLYLGARCILMSPQAFLEKPLRWLAAISKYRATTSGGPNFAYDLCVRKTTSQERAALDLSCWDLAFNGAEPVRPETLNRFAAAFACAGFSRSTFFPCYGLAEGTLLVTGGEKHELPREIRIDKRQLEENVLTTADAATETLELTGCGRPWHGARLRIVDPQTNVVLPDGHIGEIWIAGPNVAQGYWNKPEETAESFAAFTTAGEGPFLRSGDLGAMTAGELYVTGRSKDLIILRGRNLYPHDLELAVQEAHSSFRPGCGAAFSIDVEGEEKLVFVQECHASVGAELAEDLLTAIRAAVLQSFQQRCHDILIVKPHTLAKTSSGKLRRSHVRTQYLKQGFEDRIVARGLSTAGLSTHEPLPPVVARRVSPPSKRQPILGEGDDHLLLGIVHSLHGDLGERSSAASYPPETTLSSLGIDSISLVELSSLIEVHFRQEIAPQRLMQLDTIGRIASELASGGSRCEREIPQEQTWTIRPASTVRDLRSVYHLRYRIYVQEMQLTQPFADHQCRMIVDPLDPHSHVLIACDEERNTIGTLRCTRLDMAAAKDYLPILGIQGMPPSRLRQASLSSRLAVAPEYRASTLALGLCRAQYQYARQMGIRLDYAYCYDEMLPFFLRLGYAHVRDDVHHPEFGSVNVVCLDVQDDEFLTRSRSLLLFDDLVTRPLSIAG